MQGVVEALTALSTTCTPIVTGTGPSAARDDCWLAEAGAAAPWPWPQVGKTQQAPLFLALHVFPRQHSHYGVHTEVLQHVSRCIVAYYGMNVVFEIATSESISGRL